MMGPAETEVMVCPPAAGWVGVSIMGPAETEVMVSPLPAGWVNVSIMGPAKTEVMVSPLCHFLIFLADQLNDSVH